MLATRQGNSGMDLVFLSQDPYGSLKPIYLFFVDTLLFSPWYQIQVLWNPFEIKKYGTRRTPLLYNYIAHSCNFFSYVIKYRLSSKFTVRPGGVSLFLKDAQTVCVSRDLSYITAVGFPSPQLCKRQRAAPPLWMLCSAVGLGCCSQQKRLVFRSMFWKTMGAEQTFVLQSCFFSGTSNLHERLSCFISTTRQFILSPKNTQGCQWSLGMHVVHRGLNEYHYSANNIKNILQTVNVLIFLLNYLTRNIIHIHLFLTIFSSIAQYMQNSRYSYASQ